VIAPDSAVNKEGRPSGRVCLYWAGWTGMLFSSRPAHAFSRIARILPIDPASAPRASLALAAACLQRC
jgi:long-chain acyl-CoA synthetase